MSRRISVRITAHILKRFPIETFTSNGSFIRRSFSHDYGGGVLVETAFGIKVRNALQFTAALE
jgi:hypothetical protein